MEVAVAKKPRVIADLADTLRASSALLGFLPTWRLTQTLEDEHTDCTHYCLDSGVHDAVLDSAALRFRSTHVSARDLCAPGGTSHLGGSAHCSMYSASASHFKSD